MSSSVVRDDSLGDERVIRSLSGRTGVPPAAIRTLFSREFARLEPGAKVRSYLPALTAASVRALLLGGDDRGESELANRPEG